MIIRTQMKHWLLVHIIHHLEDPNGTSHSTSATRLLTYRSGCIRAGDFQVMDLEKESCAGWAQVCKPGMQARLLRTPSGSRASEGYWW